MCYATYKPCKSLNSRTITFDYKENVSSRFTNVMSGVYWQESTVFFLVVTTFGIKTRWIFDSVLVMQGSLAYSPHFWASNILRETVLLSVQAEMPGMGVTLFTLVSQAGTQKQNNKIQFHTQAIKLLPSVSIQGHSNLVCETRLAFQSAYNMRSVPSITARLNTATSRRHF